MPQRVALSLSQALYIKSQVLYYHSQCCKYSVIEFYSISLSLSLPPLLLCILSCLLHGIRAKYHGFRSCYNINKQHQHSIYQSFCCTFTITITSPFEYVKLDYSNFILWKRQLVAILEAYPLIKHIDGSVSQPCPFLFDTQGNPTTVVNPDSRVSDMENQR